jgi:ribosomal-protein-alanine N-acetyltransferase
MRITLRPLELTDWPAVHEWARTEEACRYQAWGPNTPEQTQEFVRTATAAWSERPQTSYPWVAVEPPGDVAGMGILMVRSAKFGQGEISYIVHPAKWGRGIATDIARQLVEFGFGKLDMHRIAATCDPRNIGSASVLRKTGMTYEGRMRQVQLIRDGWRDSELYSVLRDEWRADPTDQV